MNTAGKLLGASILTLVTAMGIVPARPANAESVSQNGAADLAWQKEFDTWRAAAKSGKLDDYRNYLKLYPAGKFANVAKRRIEKMDGASSASKTDVSAPADKTLTVKADTATATREMKLPQTVDQPSGKAALTEEPSASPTKQDQTVKAADGGKTDDADYAAWKKAASGNSAEDYKNYLTLFPKGKFAALANARLVQIEADLKPQTAVSQKPPQEKSEGSVVKLQLPAKVENDAVANSPAKPDVETVKVQPAEKPAEDAVVEEQPKPVGDRVALSAAGRREIQGRLSALGYNTAGADGAFGPRTRAAIRKWQVANGFEADGFLDEEQVGKLKAQSRTVYQRWQLAESQRLADEQMALQRQRYVRDNRDNAILVRPRSDRRVYTPDGQYDPEIGGPVVIRRADPYRERVYREYRRPRYLVCDDFGFCE